MKMIMSMKYHHFHRFRSCFAVLLLCAIIRNKRDKMTSKELIFSILLQFALMQKYGREQILASSVIKCKLCLCALNI